MADLKPQDVVNAFNNKIRNPLNSGISWGYGHYPPTPNGQGLSDYKSLFTGSVSGANASPDVGQMSGDVDVASLKNLLLYEAHWFTNIRRVHVYTRYKHNDAQGPIGQVWGGWGYGSSHYGPDEYDVLVNQTRIGHLHSGYLQNIGDPGNLNDQGEDASLSNVGAYLDSIRGQLDSIKYSTVTFSKVYCHSSCHNSCHGSCHGDGPGGGGGV